MKHCKNKLTLLLLSLLLLFSGCAEAGDAFAPVLGTETASDAITLDEVPTYSGEPYVVLNQNQPNFTQDDVTEESFERYGALDELGRCTVAFANIGVDLMPTEERGSIGQVKPSGWQTVKYDSIDGKYLYNRCHLIGFQLTGENANRENLITGTRYLNIEGMLPFENMVADYVKETGTHVLYRATPIFHGDELLARGVEMEGMSVEDAGEGILFHVYCYNVQPGIEIDYATGDSYEADAGDTSGEVAIYVLNTSNKKFHLPDCASVAQTKAENREDYFGARSDLIAQGYEPCGRCKP